MQADSDLREVVGAKTARFTTPLSVVELVRAYEGRACMRFADGFGCGASVKVAAGTEQSVSAQFTLGAGAIVAGTKVTVSQEWQYTARRCEYCEPKACFPEARIEEWKDTLFFSYAGWSFSRTRFHPNGRANLHANCRDNADECNCRDAQSGPSTPPPGARLRGLRPASLLGFGAWFYRGRQPTYAPQSALDDFSDRVSAALQSAIGDEDEVGLPLGDGSVYWLATPFPPQRSSEKMHAWPLSVGAMPAIVQRPGEEDALAFPIIAVCDAVPGLSAHAVLSGQREWTEAPLTVALGRISVLTGMLYLTLSVVAQMAEEQQRFEIYLLVDGQQIGFTYLDFPSPEPRT